jgi:hypothetical protein
MNDQLSRLIGEWLGEGHGEYPTITSFHYRETLRFTAAGDGLHYEQKTQRLVGPEQYAPSHQESGFLRLLEDNQVELTNTQLGGRMEILSGLIEATPGGLQLILHSTHLTNDPRMVRTTRSISLDGNALQYTMHMQTTAVPRLAIHLEANLQRTYKAQVL